MCVCGEAVCVCVCVERVTKVTNILEDFLRKSVQAKKNKKRADVLQRSCSAGPRQHFREGARSRPV